MQIEPFWPAKISLEPKSPKSTNLIMKNNLYEHGPALLCFELLEKIYGHNEE